MARVKTFTNGGSLLPGDLNSMEDDYEFAFSTYKDLVRRGGTASAPAAATYVLLYEGVTGGPLVVPARSDQAGPIYIDPTDYTANTRSNKLRVRAGVINDAVAPAVNFTIGLYPVATWGGASGSVPTVATLGAVVAGSTVAINTPAAAGPTIGNSGDFTAPAAGWYVLGVVVSGAAAAGSDMTFAATLQCRQV